MQLFLIPIGAYLLGPVALILVPWLLRKDQLRFVPWPLLFIVTPAVVWLAAFAASDKQSFTSFIIWEPMLVGVLSGVIYRIAARVGINNILPFKIASLLTIVLALTFLVGRFLPGLPE